jgi:hypothetical protein
LIRITYDISNLPRRSRDHLSSPLSPNPAPHAHVFHQTLLYRSHTFTLHLRLHPFQSPTRMFSQRSFVPVEQLPPPRSTATDHTTPLEEEDDFDLDDPRFHTRSRASSLVGLEDQESARGETSNSPGVRALAEEVDKVSLGVL